MLEHALRYARFGWPVFPVHYPVEGQCSCNGVCSSPCKHPLTLRGHKDASLDEVQIKQWWADHSQANIGGVVPFTFDIDVERGGVENLQKLEAERGALPPTWKQKTGSGGFHYVFELPEGFNPGNSRGSLPEGIDVRSGGKGYILLSPSRTLKGPYEIIRLCRPAVLPWTWWYKPTEHKLVSLEEVPEFQALPSSEQERLTAYVNEVRTREKQRLWRLRNGEGEWDNTVFAVACNLMELAKAPWAPYSVEEATNDVRLAAPAPDENGWTLERREAKLTSAHKTVMASEEVRPFPEKAEDLESRIKERVLQLRVYEEARKRFASHSSIPVQPSFSGSALEVLRYKEEVFDFVIPGLLARKERFIVTGFEGFAGKTTLLRQIAVCVAHGLHPFTFEEVEPKRVLYVDLENGPAVEISSFKRLLERVTPSTSLQIRVWDSGINLASGRDRDLLLREAKGMDLLIMGPIYKMCVSLDRKDDLHASSVIQALDKVRNELGCAVILEQHSPNTTDEDKQRLKRPYGSQMWLGWPEFGKWLGKAGEVYALEDWRGDRVPDRDWPSTLQRGEDWPWERYEGGAEVKDTLTRTEDKLLEVVKEASTKLSQRELARLTGVPQKTVNRILGGTGVYTELEELRKAWLANQRLGGDLL